MAFFNDSLIAATANNKTNMLNWVNSVNTESWNIGLKDNYKNNILSKNENLPMKHEDISHWLKAFINIH